MSFSYALGKFSAEKDCPQKTQVGQTGMILNEKLL